MRVAVNGEHAWKRNFVTVPEIWIDGRRLFGVIEADDVEGFVVHARRNAEGHMYADETGEKIATERLTGKVEIVGKRRESQPIV